MPDSNTGPLRITVVADSDTRWKWGALVARRIDPAARLDARLLRGRATPTARQLSELALPADAMTESTAAQILADVHGGSCDVVVLACVGGTVQALLHGFRSAWAARTAPPGRPVVVTGYVGVVYEKLTDGLLLRAGADVVLANSPADAGRFKAVYEGVGHRADAVVRGALPFLGGPPYAPDPARPFTVTFAVQPSAPRTRADRRYLARRAVEHARRRPERAVLVKLRSKPGEHTTHIEEHPYQRLVAALDPPDNLSLVYGAMGEVLDRTDLLVTVSSTAAMEALHRGIATAVLTDLGIRESLGNHAFLGSGCFASWDELDDGRLPQGDAPWVVAHGAGRCAQDGDAGAFAALRTRVGELLAARPELPDLDPYYTQRTAPGYLPAVLGRHLDPGAPPGRVREAVHLLVRDAARGAYRHSAQRLAPALRRLAQL